MVKTRPFYYEEFSFYDPFLLSDDQGLFYPFEKQTNLSGFGMVKTKWLPKHSKTGRFVQFSNGKKQKGYLTI
jgi:hypothetical protein